MTLLPPFLTLVVSAYYYSGSMDTDVIFPYRSSRPRFQGLLGKSGAVLPGWRRIRERIGRASNWKNG